MVLPGQRDNGVSHPDGESLGFAEDLYARYLQDAGNVPAGWRDYFARLQSVKAAPPSSRPRPWSAPRIVSGNRVIREAVYTGSQGEALESAEYQTQVNQLVRNYRVRGHIIAQLDPLKRSPPCPPELELGSYGFDKRDLERPVRSIASRKPVRDGYLDHLLKLGDISRDEAEQIAQRQRDEFEQELSAARHPDTRRPRRRTRGIWTRGAYQGGREQDVPDGRSATIHRTSHHVQRIRPVRSADPAS